jgi:hypothetical protein
MTNSSLPLLLFFNSFNYNFINYYFKDFIILNLIYLLFLNYFFRNFII